MTKSKILLLALLIISFGCNKGSQEKSINDPGTERKIDKSEVKLYKTFCKAIKTRRQVIKASKINSQINISVKSSTCEDANAETNSYSAVYDQDLSGALYIQTAGDLCQKKIWSDKVEPLATYCDNIYAGEKSDRVKIDLSLYVFEVLNDPIGVLVNIREYSVDFSDNNNTSFQAGHQLFTITNSGNSKYGQVKTYNIQEQCTQSSFITTCEQSF